MKVRKVKARRKPRAAACVPPRIIVEVMSSADVGRLEAADRHLEARIDALHRTFYEFLEVYRRDRR